MFYKCVCFLQMLLLFRLIQSANILALVPSLSRSHQIVYDPLWKELSIRGHHVTVLSPNPVKDPKLTNLTELNTNWTYKYSENFTHYIQQHSSMWKFNTVLWNTMYYVCDEVLSSSLGEFMLHKKGGFDLVMAENICPEFLAFAQIYNCPKILITTMSLPAIFYNTVRDFSHPILYPEFLTPFYGELNFKERVISTLLHWYLRYSLTFSLVPDRTVSVRKYFNSTSTVLELIADIDMLFLNVHPLIQRPRAIGPATITIGGHRGLIKSETMTYEIQKFLDDANEGCILISLESNLKSSELSSKILKSIIDALRELPFKVLWKYEIPTDDMPKNVKTAEWLPQQQILNHPNLKLFVSHGGLQSMEESIYGEVPLVILPFFLDQFQNARIVEYKNIGVALNAQYLSKDIVKDAIFKIMKDPRYYERIKKLKQLILDEPMTGLEKALWWTEYVIRNKGAKHLKNPVIDLPFYQYYLLDVMGFFLFLIILLSSITMMVLKMIHRKLYRLLDNKKKMH